MVVLIKEVPISTINQDISKLKKNGIKYQVKKLGKGTVGLVGLKQTISPGEKEMGDLLVAKDDFSKASDIIGV